MTSPSDQSHSHCVYEAMPAAQCASTSSTNLTAFQRTSIPRIQKSPSGTRESLVKENENMSDIIQSSELTIASFAILPALFTSIGGPPCGSGYRQLLHKRSA